MARQNPRYVAQTSGCLEGGFVLGFGVCVCALGLFYYFSFCAVWMKHFKRESDSGKSEHCQCFLMQAALL